QSSRIRHALLITTILSKSSRGQSEASTLLGAEPIIRIRWGASDVSAWEESRDVLATGGM
ncbi:MAG: hypothetical protein ACPHOL_09300, partial [Candidatus Puniceispirillum sp.]